MHFHVVTIVFSFFFFRFRQGFSPKLFRLPCSVLFGNPHKAMLFVKALFRQLKLRLIFLFKCFERLICFARRRPTSPDSDPNTEMIITDFVVVEKNHTGVGGDSLNLNVPSVYSQGLFVSATFSFFFNFFLVFFQKTIPMFRRQIIKNIPVCSFLVDQIRKKIKELFLLYFCFF